VACTGVHGANRLASNSLLEGLVFAGRIGARMAAHPGVVRDPILPEHPGQRLLAHQARRRVQKTMDTHVGVLRSAHSLELAEKELSALASSEEGRPSTEDWETTNIHTLATVVTRHAAMRTETRGSHWREDFPLLDDEHWRLRLVTNLDSDGTMRTRKVSRTGVTYEDEG